MKIARVPSARLNRLALGAAAALAAAVMIFVMAPDARADVTWVMTDVALSDGGTLNGTFTLNVYGYLSNWDITTSGGTGAVGSYTYQPVINAMINDDRTEVTFVRNVPYPYYGDLQLTFADPLTKSGVDELIGGIEGPSSECGGWSCGPAPIRYVSGDARIAGSVPEPATWAMMLIGFAGIGVAGMRMRRRSISAN